MAPSPATCSCQVTSWLTRGLVFLFCRSGAATSALPLRFGASDAIKSVRRMTKGQDLRSCPFTCVPSMFDSLEVKVLYPT